MEQKCPHCGADLPEEASFCPHCATTVHRRKAAKVPVPMLRKALTVLLVLVIVSAVAGGLWLKLKPKTYDEYGQVIYTAGDGTVYQVLLGSNADRFTPQPQLTVSCEADGQYRMPSRLYINNSGSGEDANQAFLELVESASAEFIHQEDSPSPMVCSQPAYNEALPDAALISLLDFTGESTPAELVWTLYMKNGDTIRLRQTYEPELIEIRDYYPEDYPMDTMEDLQALVDQIEKDVPLPTVVNLHLPAVTYEGELTIQARPFNVYGSTDADGSRTTFTGTVFVTCPNSDIMYFQDLDFVGSGTGCGVSTSAFFRATNCSFTNWETGVLAYGTCWVNVIGCRFDGNQVGFDFNSTGEYVNHSLFNDNHFSNNGTAVLLEAVPTDVTMDFQGSVFSNNQTDIDNRCDQPLDLSQATFDIKE